VTSQETIDLLNGLVETCRDGELGYRTAAEAVSNTQLETVFSDYSKQRAGFVRQLQAEVERLGGIPAGSGTVTGTLYRGWMDVKSALSGGDGAAIIASCETGEDSAAASFERVFDMDISGQPKQLVESQWKKIKEAHQRMIRLKEEMSRTDYQKTDKK
jgi:uncharacterized protein (TIGR02284 family)